MSKSKSRVTLGLIFGAVAGFFAGVLSAPQSGKKTRKDIKDSAVDLKKKAISTAEDVADRAVDVAEDVRDRALNTVDDLKDRAADVVEDVRDRATDTYEDTVDTVGDWRHRASRAVESAKKEFKADSDEAVQADKSNK
jgi:gas vesicle protein